MLILHQHYSQYHVKSRYYKPSNLFLLRLQVTVLKILAITPFSENSFNSNLYTSCVMGPVVAASSFEMIYLMNRPEAPVLQVLETVTTSSLTIFFCNIFYNQWKRRGAWRNLFKSIFEYDAPYFQQDLTANSKTRIILKFVLFYSSLVVFCTINITLSVVGSNGKTIRYLFIFTQHIGLIYEYQIAFFIWEIVCVLQERYTHLKEQLEKLLLQNKKVNWKMSEYMIGNGIQKIKYNYKIAKGTVEEINNIFGWIILFLLIHTVGISLHSFYGLLYVFSNRSTFFITCIIVFVAYLVSEIFE